MSNQAEKLVGQFERFIDHGDGTVTDARTGLMWKRLSERVEQAGGLAETFSFVQAMAKQGSVFAGYADWRLPSIEELRSLLDKTRMPMLDFRAFPVHSGHYFWSSTLNNEPGSRFDNHALIVTLAGGLSGFGNPHTGSEHVRLVRGVMGAGSHSEASPVLPTKIEIYRPNMPLGQPITSAISSSEMAFQENIVATQFALTVLTTGVGLGEVKRDPDLTSYGAGQVVCLTAIAQFGSKFLDWRGDVVGGHFVCNLRMDSAKTVSAAFELVDVAEMGDVIQTPRVVVAGALQQMEVIQNGNLDRVSTTLVDANGVAFDTSNKSSGRRIGHFYDHGDGTVTDTRTGLMWKCAAEGQGWDGVTCTGAPKFFSFRDACEIQSGFAGHTNWRLPNGHESHGLYLNSPSGGLDKLAFPNQAGGRIWSSFSVGSLGRDQITGRELVRLVRDGQRFVLDVKIRGLGSGRVERDVETDTCAFGQVITLTAQAAVGFKFKAWHGDASGSNPVCTVMMDSAKTVLAEFEDGGLEWFELKVTSTGTGAGAIARSLDAEKYPTGTVVTLAASAAIGSKFIGWGGDAIGGDAAYSVTMDSAKVVLAEFGLTESYALDVAASGTGTGVVVRSSDAATHLQGAMVTLTAQPSEGSIFNRWLGDAVGLDEVCVVQMSSAKVIEAEFEKVSVPDFGLVIDFESAEVTSMKSGDAAIIFYLSVRNQGANQTRIAMPLASYVNQLGEEIEQSVWLSGMVIGNDGVNIRAGAFRKMGLVFYKSRLSNIAKGDRLYLKVIQSKPAREICFTLKCVETKSRAFVVVNAVAEDQQEPPETVATSVALTHILQRVVLLEEGMAKLLGILDALPRDSLLAVADAIDNPALVQTLREVLTRLVLQDRVSIATFRVQLLPLDLLPNAVINEVNERALDLTGEMALEEAGDEIVVKAGIFDQVLANWDWEQV